MKKMKRKALIFSVLLAAAAMLTSSCALRNEAAREGCRGKIGIVFDIGGKNDRSFNAAAWEGVQRAERELGVCLYDVEPGNPTSIEPAMRSFAEKDLDRKSVV